MNTYKNEKITSQIDARNEDHDMIVKLPRWVSHTEIVPYNHNNNITHWSLPKDQYKHWPIKEFFIWVNKFTKRAFPSATLSKLTPNNHLVPSSLKFWFGDFFLRHSWHSHRIGNDSNALSRELWLWVQHRMKAIHTKEAPRSKWIQPIYNYKPSIQPNLFLWNYKCPNIRYLKCALKLQAYLTHALSNTEVAWKHIGNARQKI